MSEQYPNVKLTTDYGDARSLLLYLEDCAVNNAGRVGRPRLNDSDMDRLKLWSADKFVEFGRLKIKHHNADGGFWVRLSDAAWDEAAKLRKLRGRRREHDLDEYHADRRD